MRQLFIILFLITGLQVFCDEPMAPAGTSQEQTLSLPNDQPPPVMEDFGVAFFKVIMMLLAILALVFLTVWVIKKYGHGRLGRFKDNQSIHVLERRILSPKTVLYLVEVEGARLVVAESQLEVRPLHQWQASSEEGS